MERLLRKPTSRRIKIAGGEALKNCPKCGTGIENPSKRWPLLGRANADGTLWKTMIAIYECPNCGTKFRVADEKERVRIINVQRLEELEVSLMEATEKKAELEAKVKSLEEEKSRLLEEIKTLRERIEIAELEAKARSLEDEVSKLKAESESLKEKASSLSSTA
jgi:DNA repair exonuclease SbcCD ATPase subunit